MATSVANLKVKEFKIDDKAIKELQKAIEKD